MNKILDVDLQTKKIDFVQDFLRLTDEVLVDKLMEVLSSERRKKKAVSPKPMTKEKLDRILDQAEEDSKNGRLTTADQLDKEIDSWG